MNKFQITYLLTFLISFVGIFSNIELDISTPIINWIIFGISSFLVIGKLIYLERRN